MKILLHTCCAVCTLGPLRELQQEGHRVSGWFYNPNIHPLLEFRRRLKSQKVLQARLSAPMTCDEQYGLREFLDAVDWRGPRRCADCHRLRLRRAAAEAGRGGFDAFTTTLLTSAHQAHELVRATGQECAEAEGVAFVYRDWRPLAEDNHRQASRLGLYLQQYCGCIFSEHERFKDTTRHLYRA